jgi:hypothetical protein
LESAFRELIKARLILCGCHAYGYYLEDRGYNKTILDYLIVSCISLIRINLLRKLPSRTFELLLDIPAQNVFFYSTNYIIIRILLLLNNCVLFSADE